MWQPLTLGTDIIRAVTRVSINGVDDDLKRKILIWCFFIHRDHSPSSLCCNWSSFKLHGLHYPALIRELTSEVYNVDLIEILICAVSSISTDGNLLYYRQLTTELSPQNRMVVGGDLQALVFDALVTYGLVADTPRSPEFQEILAGRMQGRGPSALGTTYTFREISKFSFAHPHWTESDMAVFLGYPVGDVREAMRNRAYWADIVAPDPRIDRLEAMQRCSSS